MSTMTPAAHPPFTFFLYVCQSQPATIRLGADVCVRQATMSKVSCKHSPIRRNHVWIKSYRCRAMYIWTQVLLQSTPLQYVLATSQVEEWAHSATDALDGCTRKCSGTPKCSTVSERKLLDLRHLLAPAFATTNTLTTCIPDSAYRTDQWLQHVQCPIAQR